MSLVVTLRPDFGHPGGGTQMSRFAGIEREQPKSDRLPTLTEGEYLLEVTENKVITTQTGDAALRTFKILEGIGPKALPVGTEAKAKLLYFSDKWVKARFAEYIRGLTNAKNIDSELADNLFGATNPAKGYRVKVRIYEADSDGGKKYLKYDWRFVEPPAEEKKAKK